MPANTKPATPVRIAAILRYAGYHASVARRGQRAEGYEATPGERDGLVLVHHHPDSASWVNGNESTRQELAHRAGKWVAHYGTLLAAKGYLTELVPGSPAPHLAVGLDRPLVPVYASIEAFYDAQPARRGSGQVNFGADWQAGGSAWPLWRVSCIQATGEVYAVRLHGYPVGPVRVLGFVQPGPGRAYSRRLNRILDGWADPDVTRHDLAWVQARLQAAAS